MGKLGFDLTTFLSIDVTPLWGLGEIKASLESRLQRWIRRRRAGQRDAAQGDRQPQERRPEQEVSAAGAEPSQAG